MSLSVRHIKHHHTPRIHDRSLTEGNLFVKILLFSLPLMATSLLQTFYNAADMMIVSYSTAPDAVGAVGATSSFLNLMLNLFIGLSVGANVVAARRYGAKDEQGISRVAHTSVWMAMIFGVAGMIVGLLIGRPLLAAMGNSGTLLELSLLYTRIYLFGLPFLSLTNYASALLRAKGDTKTPLIVLSITGLLNVGMNFLFVIGLGMTVDGVALATSLANLLSAIALLWRLHRSKDAFALSLKKLKIDRATFLEILKIGVPAGLQSAMFSISNLIIQSSILRLDAVSAPEGVAYRPVMKGSGAAANIEAFAYAASNAVYSAAITFTSCHVGAGEPRRIKRVVTHCHLAALLFATVLPFLLILFSDPLLSLYHVKVVADDPLSLIAYDAAKQRMHVVLFSFVLIAFLDVSIGVLRGIGQSLFSTMLSVVGVCALRIVWIYTIFEAKFTMGWLYACYPASWGVTWIIATVSVIFFLRRMIRKSEMEKTEA